MSLSPSKIDLPPLKMGWFITFEGGEGAGKTSLIQNIAELFSAHSIEVVVTREPGGSSFGEKMRHILLDIADDLKIGPMAELLLFLSARAQHIEEKILPALNQGKMVLCDRFNDSSLAYQGYARGLGMSKVQDLCRLVCGDLKPHITLYLDVDPLLGLKRAQNKEGSRIEPDRIEKEALAFHHLVRGGFKLIAAQEPERLQILDAHQTQEKIFEQALHLITKKIKSFNNSNV